MQRRSAWLCAVLLLSLAVDENTKLLSLKGSLSLQPSLGGKGP